MAIDSKILILCAAVDNEPITEGETGWVSNFMRFLDMMLFQVLGEKVGIEMKTEKDSISSGDLSAYKLFIPVITPAFLEVGKNRDTVEEFFKIEKGIIFKVTKARVSRDDQPTKLRNMLGYELFMVDVETGEDHQINDFFGPEAERSYWMKLVDLAYDIHEAILKAKETTAATVKPLFERKSVYLAETSHDLSIQRNIIRRELQRYGYKVLPETTLPVNSGELEETVRKELDECNLSIHLIGNSYGEIPKGSERSVVDLQNKIAGETSANGRKSGKLNRLIWISPDLKNTSERQRTFIENIKRDISALEGAEILQTPLEDFKNIIREELIDVSGEKKFQIGVSRPKIENKGTKMVYLVYDLIDEKEVNPLIKFIEKSGYEVIHPAFEGELLELRQKHIENLVEFDLALIYYGKVNLQWVRMKLLDLLKAPGFGRAKPILGRGILTGTGININKESFSLYDVDIIDGGKELPLDDIKNFLENKR